MAIQNVVGIAVPVIDDGIFYVFGVVDQNNNPVINTTGFMHRPVSASEPFGNPPVTWSESTDLGTWVETIKNSARTQRVISYVYDDSASNSYTATTGDVYQLSVLYAVTD